MSTLWAVLSDLFVNLSAGWFGFLFIESNIILAERIDALLLRLFWGIMSLIVAYIFRKLAFTKI